MVAAEHCAEACPTMNARIVRRNGRVSSDESVPQPLMIALFVKMRHVLRECTTQGFLRREDHLR